MKKTKISELGIGTLNFHTASEIICTKYVNCCSYNAHCSASFKIPPNSNKKYFERCGCM